MAKCLDQAMRKLIQVIESDFNFASREPWEPGNSSTSMSGILSQLQEHTKLEKTRRELVMPATRQHEASALFQQAEQCRWKFSQA